MRNPADYKAGLGGQNHFETHKCQGANGAPGPDMAVANPFVRRTPERVEALRALAFVGSLAGVGAAGALFAVDARNETVTVGLLAALALGFSLAGRVWLLPGWRLGHTAYALLTGINWILLGFFLEPSQGAVPVVLGAALVGTGLAGVATGTLRTPVAGPGS